MYLGIDVGTSAITVALVDEEQQLVGQAEASLTLETPRPNWSEQTPEAWWVATQQAVQTLRASVGKNMGAIKAIGLSGQMHGATLLGPDDAVLRPAMLWNDERSSSQCAELERRVPDCRRITGNITTPGFTAPKLLWVAEHEPEVFGRISKILLPKDYLRFRMTGDHATERSDASGTLWLDTERRNWSEAMLAATGLSEQQMPELFEGSEATGTVLPAIRESWGLREGVAVAGGAGDNAAGALGAGVVGPGQALLSLSGAGVYFVASDRYRANPDDGVQTFCGCLPSEWHQLGMSLNAGSCLSWVTALTGAADELSLLAEVEASPASDEELLFLPYLGGERTPHNDPLARGVFFGLSVNTRRADLARAVLEGVAFALCDVQAALLATGSKLERVEIMGPGAQSALWRRILASALKRPLVYRQGHAAAAGLGPAMGAALLGRLAVTGEAPGSLGRRRETELLTEPDRTLEERFAERLPRFRRLYQNVRASFPRRNNAA